jgi:hypothetical protein
VTHPFHPLFGREFPIATRRHNWSAARVYFYGPGGQLASVPEAWTDLARVDPFVALSAGRSPFRPEDLVELLRLVRGLAGRPASP